MSANTIGLLLLVICFVVFFGGNILIGRKYGRYERTPENPGIGSLDPQIDAKEGLNLLTYFLFPVIWFVLSMGLIMGGFIVFSS